MIILVDKPKGITSFDVIRNLRNKIQNKKMWHGWTLDPMATGLLIIGTDKDTKKLQDLQKWNKEYIATIDFSIQTDTRDLDFYQYIQEYKVHWDHINKDWEKIQKPKLKQIKTHLNNLLWKTKIQVPYFSAKKKNGKKLYQLAREWKRPEIYSQMHIYDYEILDYSFPKLEIKIKVWWWTYIRSIAHWLGKNFKLWGILSQLRRMSIGNYKLKSKTNKENKIKIIKKLQ